MTRLAFLWSKAKAIFLSTRGYSTAFILQFCPWCFLGRLVSNASYTVVQPESAVGVEETLNAIMVRGPRPRKASKLPMTPSNPSYHSWYNP